MSFYFDENCISQIRTLLQQEFCLPVEELDQQIAKERKSIGEDSLFSALKKIHIHFTPKALICDETLFGILHPMSNNKSRHNDPSEKNAKETFWDILWPHCIITFYDLLDYQLNSQTPDLDAQKLIDFYHLKGARTNIKDTFWELDPKHATKDSDGAASTVKTQITNDRNNFCNQNVPRRIPSPTTDWLFKPNRITNLFNEKSLTKSTANLAFVTCYYFKFARADSWKGTIRNCNHLEEIWEKFYSALKDFFNNSSTDNTQLNTINGIDKADVVLLFHRLERYFHRNYWEFTLANIFNFPSPFSTELLTYLIELAKLPCSYTCNFYISGIFLRYAALSDNTKYFPTKNLFALQHLEHDHGTDNLAINPTYALEPCKCEVIREKFLQVTREAKNYLLELYFPFHEALFIYILYNLAYTDQQSDSNALLYRLYNILYHWIINDTHSQTASNAKYTWEDFLNRLFEQSSHTIDVKQHNFDKKIYGYFLTGLFENDKHLYRVEQQSIRLASPEYFINFTKEIAQKSELLGYHNLCKSYHSDLYNDVEAINIPIHRQQFQIVHGLWNYINQYPTSKKELEDWYKYKELSTNKTV